MNTSDRIAVCSRSFSRNPVLRKELQDKYSNITFNDKGLSLKGDLLFKFLDKHDKAIVALEKIDSQLLNKLPQLSVISKYGVGLDMIQMDAMRMFNKRLGWKGGVNRRSVSELVISFAIALLRFVPNASHEVLNGSWSQHIGSQLSGKKIGIIGCGHVGKDLVKILQPFDCDIYVNDIRDYSEYYKKYDLQPIPLEDLLMLSDVVTLHVPLDKSTINILNKEKLSLMKSSAILINIARGGLVDEAHLKKILIEKKIAGAAFDVFETEPPQDKELIALTNFIVTPHIGGSSVEAILAMGRAAIEGLEINSIPSPSEYS